jgi:hypothetical protein
MGTRLAVVILLLLGACTERVNTEDGEFKNELSKVAQAACPESVGRWIPMPYNYGVCNERTLDAGKQCSSHRDCIGLCVVKIPIAEGVTSSGVCHEYESGLAQCLQRVEEGIAGPVICVD